MSCWGVLQVDANPANPAQTGLVKDSLESLPKPQPQWFGGRRLWRVEEVDIICAEAERAQTRAG